MGTCYLFSPSWFLSLFMCLQSPPFTQVMANIISDERRLYDGSL